MKRVALMGGCALLAAIGITALAGTVTAQPSASLACSVDALQAAAPADTIVFSADRVANPVSHCRVEGFVTATNPGPNRAYFRLQLPDKALWKGRFYFIGLGGAAGYVPTDSQIPPGNPLVKGFAVAGTDTGHKGDLLDWGFLADPVKTLDHRDRAAHLTTVAAQKLTRAYYGASKMWRYHTGCSGGGRMGGEAITRHPEDYDGVLLGDGRVNTLTRLGAGMYKFIHSSQVMNREPGAWLSPQKLQMADRKVTEACDLTDGAKDGIVWDHRACKFNFNTIKCKSGDGPDCLTQPEITSIRQLLDGPRGAKGEQFAEGWPISNMSMWSMFLGQQAPPWSRSATPQNMSLASAGYIIAATRGSGFFGADFDPLKFDIKDPKNIDKWETLSRAQQFEGSPDLTQFEKTGGKVMLFVGVSSPCCSNLEMQRYVDKVTSERGAAKAREYIAMYEFPGIGHCSGGPGPQDGPDRLMDELVAWVEDGKQPGPLVTHHGADKVKMVFAANADTPIVPKELTGDRPIPMPKDTGVSRDFLLCPYPQRSVFDKSKAATPGAVLDAANWSCR